MTESFLDQAIRIRDLREGKKKKPVHIEPEKVTLSELWRIYQRPFRVRLSFWAENEWFQVMGIAPSGLKQAYGFFTNGSGCGYSSTDKIWIFMSVKPLE